MPTQRKSKSLALKTINERVEAHDSSDEDVVEKDVAYLAKNFRKFLKFKNIGKFDDKGKSINSEKEKKESLVLNVMDMAISKRNVLIT